MVEYVLMVIILNLVDVFGINKGRVIINVDVDLVLFDNVLL